MPSLAPGEFISADKFLLEVYIKYSFFLGPHELLSASTQTEYRILYTVLDCLCHLEGAKFSVALCAWLRENVALLVVSVFKRTVCPVLRSATK